MKTILASILALAMLALVGCANLGSQTSVRQPGAQHFRQIVVTVDPLAAHIRLLDENLNPLEDRQAEAGHAQFAVNSGATVVIEASAPGYEHRQWIISPSDHQVRLKLEPTAEMSEKMARDARGAREREIRAQAADIPGLNEEMISAIADRQILAGMPRKAVELSWGAPTRRNLQGGMGGEIEIWDYSRWGGPRSDMLYFVDGILARWSLDR